MNKPERIKLIKSMEFIIRQLNAEDQIDWWLVDGIADGDIPYGELDVKAEDEDLLDYFLDDKEFAHLMKIFLATMHEADEDGGLYCDGVVSE